MGTTPVALYKRGNNGGPRMDHVRPVDVTIFVSHGAAWVRRRSGGISTFSSVPSGRGRVWRLPASRLKTWNWTAIAHCWRRLGVIFCDACLRMEDGK